MGNSSSNIQGADQADGTSGIASLAHWLDSKYKTPFGLRIGFDGIIGLIPGIGDAFTASLSLYIIFKVAMAGYPRSILIRMLGNVALENVIGTIPIVGSIFDFFWKANSRNIKLLREFDSQGTAPTTRSPLFYILVIFFTLTALALLLGLSVYLAYWLIISLVQGLS